MPQAGAGADIGRSVGTSFISVAGLLIAAASPIARDLAGEVFCGAQSSDGQGAESGLSCFSSKTWTVPFESRTIPVNQVLKDFTLRLHREEKSTSEAESSKSTPEAGGKKKKKKSWISFGAKKTDAGEEIESGDKSNNLKYRVGGDGKSTGLFKRLQKKLSGGSGSSGGGSGGPADEAGGGEDFEEVDSQPVATQDSEMFAGGDPMITLRKKIVYQNPDDNFVYENTHGGPIPGAPTEVLDFAQIQERVQKKAKELGIKRSSGRRNSQAA